MEARSETSKTTNVKPTRRRLLVVVALLPFTAAVLQWFGGSSPATVSGSVDRPALTFHQYMVNLGPVRPTPIIGARFRFTNTGEDTVKITEVIPSCGCLKPRLAKREYLAGESGEFILPVQTPNQNPGPHEYRVVVRYTDPKPRETTLTFRVTLPDKQLMVQPRSLIFYQLGFGETKQKIVVTDYPKTGLKLVDATSDSDLATLQLEKSDTDKFGNPRHTVTVTVPGTVPPGQHRALITLLTDHKRYKTIRVPIIIRGRKTESDRTAKKPRSQPDQR